STAPSRTVEAHTRFKSWTWLAPWRWCSVPAQAQFGAQYRKFTRYLDVPVSQSGNQIMATAQSELSKTPVETKPGDASVAKRLRVLFLISRDIRHPSNTGGDVGLWERALYLAGEGHDVTVMA